jgi:acyl-CoA synthetase
MGDTQSAPMLTLLNAPTIAAYTAAGFWGDETIYHLAARHARTTPQACAVRDRHRWLSYAELVAAAARLAAHLAGNGVRPGHRVAVWLSSRVETAIALLACSRNGYVCCPSLHRNHTVGEIAALVDSMRATVLIAQPGYGADADRHDVFAELADRSFLRCTWRVGPAEAAPFGELPGPALEMEAGRDANQVMYLPFTSGTTGKPKGVMHSDNTLIATARMIARDWRLERAVLYTLSPLSHNLGLGALITALVGGGQLVAHDLPPGASLLDRLEETSAEFLFGVPTHAIDLLSEMRARGTRHVGAVRGFRISGAAAPALVVAELMQCGILPQSGYGMTETCSHQYTLPDDPPERIVDTCGRACAGYDIRIWRQDDPGTEAPPGEIGEIGGRGASLMLGYFGDQKATEAAFNAQGWFMTGDLGWIDEAGYLRVTGRKKDVIIRGGRNIHPVGIEALALRHDAIEKAAAFPVADARLGERVCLAVVARGDMQVDPEAILEHLDASGLSRYDMPEFILPLSEMPLTASGKLLKRELVQRVAEGRVRPLPVRFRPRSAARG